MSSQAWAVDAGQVGSIYFGTPPSDLHRVCGEFDLCTVNVPTEVWYGLGERWHFRLMDGIFRCGNEVMTDPSPGDRKSCYVRPQGQITGTPPKLTHLPVTFVFNDFSTAQNGRFGLNVASNGHAIGLAGTGAVPFMMQTLSFPSSAQMAESYFQFSITDSGDPIRNYSVVLASTAERCLVHKPFVGLGTETSVGRVIEYYTLTTEPAQRVIPARSETQRVCTNDTGKLTFQLRAPSVDAFQIKIINHGVGGQPNGVADLFIPTRLNLQGL